MWRPQGTFGWILGLLVFMVISACIQGTQCRRKGPLSTTGLDDNQESAPRWKKKMEAKILVGKQHGSVQMRCLATGSPYPTVRWLKDGASLEVDAAGNRLKETRNSLILSELRQSDAGRYTCVVENKLGMCLWNYTLRINVTPVGQVPPHILEMLNVTGTEGGNVSLRCNFISPSTVHVQWIKPHYVNGSFIVKNGSLQFDTLQETNPMSDGRAEFLTLTNISLTDAGPYTCVIANQHGKNHKTIWLSVTPNPLMAVKKSDNTWVTILVAASCLIVVLAIVFCAAVCICREKRRNKLTISQQRRHDVMNPIYPFISEDEFLIPYDQMFEFPRQNLRLGDTLGEGAFGLVMKGFAIGLGGKMEPVIVAIKMLKCDATPRELHMLVQEMETMKSIRKHKNIINFLGCCTQDGPLYVLVELAAHGNLRDFLKAQRPPESCASGYERPRPYIAERAITPLKNKDLLSFSLQIARGMAHLAAQKIIHRDLAARNILVSEDYVLKIADFGLTKELTKEADYYRKTTDGRLPIKWMAPESLSDRKFTTKSDVWSFGVLLWEIFTFGSNPYPSVPIESLYQLLKEGTRMEKPRYSTVEMYSIMLRSWRDNPRDRPSFDDLENMIDSMLCQAADNEYLNLEPTQEEVLDDEVFDPVVTQMHARRSDSQYSSMSSEHSHSMTPPSGKSPRHARLLHLTPNREASDEDNDGVDDEDEVCSADDVRMRNCSGPDTRYRKLSTDSDDVISAGMATTSGEETGYDPDVGSQCSFRESVFGDSEGEDMMLPPTALAPRAPLITREGGGLPQGHVGGKREQQPLVLRPPSEEGGHLSDYVTPICARLPMTSPPCSASGRRGVQTSRDTMTYAAAVRDEEDPLVLRQASDPGTRPQDYRVFYTSDKVECVECQI